MDNIIFYFESAYFTNEYIEPIIKKMEALKSCG